MRLNGRHRLLLAGNPRLMGDHVEADAGALHATRHGGGEAHILITGNNVDAVLLALAMQLGPQRLPDPMRDDGVVEGVVELRRRQHGRGPVGGLLGLVERLAEHHGGQGFQRNATALAALVTLRRASSPHGREQQGGIVENQVDIGLLAASSSRSGRCGRRRGDHEENRPIQPARAQELDGRRNHQAALSPSASCTVRSPSRAADNPVVSTSRARKRSRGKAASRSSSVAGRSASKAGRTQATFSLYYFKAKILSCTPCKNFTSEGR